MKTAKLMVFNGPQQPMLAETKVLRELAPDEILVKNKYTTICGSDLHTYSGVRKEACPTVLGHEIVGTVEAIGGQHSGTDLSGQPLRIGDLVTWSVFSSNPCSPGARQGMPQKGADLFKYGHALIAGDDAFHGGLAEYCILRKGTAILRLPEDLPLPVAATINCAIATTAGALRLAGSITGKTVLVTGMGLLGLTAVAMCREAGALKVIAADVNSTRLDMARQFGADETLCFNSPDVQPPVSDINITIDMSGSPDAMEYGLDVLAIGGAAVWVGAVFNTRKIQVNPEKMIRNLITIKGLHNYNFEDFRYARDFMVVNWNRYPYATVVAKEFSLSEAGAAFDYALEHRPLRVGVRI